MATRDAEARRLGEAATGVGHLTDLAAEADLAEHHDVGAAAACSMSALDHGQGHTEVGGRLGELARRRRVDA